MESNGRGRRDHQLEDNEILIGSLASLASRYQADGRFDALPNWRDNPSERVLWSAVEGLARRYAERAGIPNPADAAALVTAIAILETGPTWRRRISWAGSGQTGDDNNLWNLAGEFGPKLSQKVADFVRMPSLAGVADGSIKRASGWFQSFPSMHHAVAAILRYLWSNPRYENAIRVQGDILPRLQAIAAAGYTPDAGWAEGIASIYRRGTAGRNAAV